MSVTGWGLTEDDGTSIPLHTADIPDHALTLLSELLGWSKPDAY
jgi:hypothetical protein